MIAATSKVASDNVGHASLFSRVMAVVGSWRPQITPSLILKWTSY
jgi:hypothetical protein